MKQIIDLEQWERKDNFRFFQDFIDPRISVTSEVTCGAAKQRAKERGESFFLHYLHAILRAANEIEQLRYRLDDHNRIVLYDTVDVLTPILVSGTDRFMVVRIPWIAQLEDFHAAATAIIQNMSVDGDPYAEEVEATSDDRYNTILVSATPDLYFTSITHAQQGTNGNDYPLLNVGKAVAREGRLVMPVSISLHHGFVDGFHISDFFKRIEQYLS